MGRDKRGSRTSGKVIAAEDVLAGRITLPARELIALIRDVNPTGRALPGPEMARRYALKARLQGVLIHRFQDDLAVVPAADEGVVTLRHRYLGVDACHAVLAELDDDARSWAQREIDLAADGSEESAPGATSPFAGSENAAAALRPEHVDDLLASGRRALDEYDFEAARHAFASAHAAAPEDLRPVLALIDLLVDRLCLDADALAFSAGLTPQQLGASEVRARLALAAARTGDLSSARARVGDLDGGLAAEVHRAICTGALERHDLGTATEALQTARRAEPGHGDLLDLQRRLDELRAASVVGREADLAAAEAAGDLAMAVDLAREILSFHPASVAARRLLRDLAERERAAEAAAAVARLEAAARAGDLEALRSEVHRARVIGLPVDVVDRHAARLSAEESRRREEALAQSIGETSRLLEDPRAPHSLEKGLRLYGQLEATARAQVRARCSRQELVWLEEAGVEGSTARRDRAVSVVLAMQSTEQALISGDAGTAGKILDAHHELISDLKSGRALAERVRAVLAAEHRTRAEAALSRAEALFSGGQVEAALTMVGSVQPSVLDEPSRERFVHLERHIANTRAREEDRRIAEQLLSEGDLVAAHARFERICAQVSGTAEDPAARAKRDEVAASLRRAWVVLDHRLPPGRKASEAPEVSPWWHPMERSHVALRPGGSEAVLATADDRFVFVRFVDVESGEIRRLLALRAPDRLGGADAIVSGDSLWLFGGDLRAVEVACADGLPRFWGALGTLVPAGVRREDAFVVPGSRIAWLRTELVSGRHESFTHVVDLDERRVLRSFDKSFMDDLVVGSSPPLVVRRAFESAARVHGARGSALFDITVPAGHHALGFAVHPSGEGFLMIAYEEEAEEEQIVVIATDARGTERSRVVVPGVGERPSTLATDLAARVSYLFYAHAEDDAQHVAILAEEDGRLVLRSEEPARGQASLLQDERATSTVCVRRVERGLELHRLSGTPRSSVSPPSESFRIPDLRSDAWCAPTSDEKDKTAFDVQTALARELSATIPAKRADWARGAMRRFASDAGGLVALLRTIEGDDMPDVVEEVIAAAERQAPEDPYVRLARIGLEQQAGRWTGEALLEGAEGPLREHLLHVKGLVLFGEGRYEEAGSVWGSVDGERCGLDHLVQLATALHDAERRDGHGRMPAGQGLGRLVHAVIRADRLLVAGDHAGVRSELDVAWIRERREEQSLARLAASYLDGPTPTDPVEQFRVATALAAFVAAFTRPERHATRLALGRHGWPPTRIAELTQRAARWLGDWGASERG